MSPMAHALASETKLEKDGLSFSSSVGDLGRRFLAVEISAIVRYRSMVITEEYFCIIFEIVRPWIFFYVDLQCPLTIVLPEAVELAEN